MYQYILFDLDGTLTNPELGITNYYLSDAPTAPSAPKASPPGGGFPRQRGKCLRSRQKGPGGGKNRP